MAKNADRPGELILENRQLLLIFFGIVALCGVFFALGYIVGRNTLAPTATAAQAESGGPGGAGKPSPMPPAAYLNQGLPGNPPAAEQPPSETELNYDQSLAEKTPEARLVPPESAKAPSSQPAGTSQPNPSGQPSEPIKPAAAEPPPPGILVQVSALTRQEDAQALVQLLKEKKLPVLVTSGTSDTLFHVVVGPYQTEREAQQVKRTLEQDGFQPIIKK